MTGLLTNGSNYCLIFGTHSETLKCHALRNACTCGIRCCPNVKLLASLLHLSAGFADVDLPTLTRNVVDYAILFSRVLLGVIVA